MGALGLAVADRIEETARGILKRSGEAPAALVVIGYGLGPSNDQLRRVLGLSHPGTVRLIDRLVADGLAQRGEGHDKRSIALHLTTKGQALREDLMRGRLTVLKPLLLPLTAAEQATFDVLLEKILLHIPRDDQDRCRLCRLCDTSVCVDCPIPAEFRK